MLNDIIRNFHGTLFNICFQKITPASLFVQFMQG
jgi:hypothetical protein